MEPAVSQKRQSPTAGEVERLKRTYRNYRLNESFRAIQDDLNPGNRAILSERFQQVHRLLQRHFGDRLPHCKILDVGCGSGKVLAAMTQLGASPRNLHGVDLLPERIREAKSTYPGLNFQEGNAEQLDFPDGTFDIVLLFTVFSSILDPKMARSLAAEVRRVLKDTGSRPRPVVLLYDLRYPNPQNPNVRAVKRAELAQLFPGFRISVRPVTLLPPVARRLGRLTRFFYPLLAAVPPLRSHYIGLLVKEC